MKTMANKQHGASLGELVAVVAILILLAMGTMKLTPAYWQDKQLKGVLEAVVNDPAMSLASDRDIRNSFAKRASMVDLTTVTAQEIEINKKGKKIVLSANYSVKIPLVSNINLLLEFNTSSSE